MLECKDCCLYDTEACRYGRYALEHNMSLNCDDFIVEHNKAYQQGRTDAIKEYKQSDEYIKECVQRYLKGKTDGQAEAIDECMTILKAHHMFRTCEDDYIPKIERPFYQKLWNRFEQLKEKKE